MKRLYKQDFELLKLLLTTESQSCLTILRWEVGWVAASQVSTRFHEFLDSEAGRLWGEIKLSLTGIRFSVWRALNLFFWKLIIFTLTVFERQNHFWGISHLLCDDKSINLISLNTKNMASIFTNTQWLASSDSFFI